MKFSSMLFSKALILFIFIGIAFISCEKNTVSVSGGNEPNADVEVINDVKYGANVNLSGNLIDLKLDVYMPANATANQKFPLVFFVHGGGFSAGDKSSASTAMETFAKAGYVGVSIDYRVDSSIDAQTDPCSIDTNTSNKVVYMSVQDARAAMRFLVANANKYHIDTTKIFFDGHSAGAVSLLNAYYLPQSYFNQVIPGVEERLGGINNADNNLTGTFSIIGMASNSGCIPDVNFINSSNVIPTIFFHGGQDSVIPVDQGHSYYCSNTLYVYGSQSLYKRLLTLGKSAVLHVDPSGGHGPYTQDFLTNNELCFFNSILSKKVESGSYTGLQSSCR